MITRMYATVMFDREITDEHYISPGGYAVRDKDGNELCFDFEYYEWDYSKGCRVIWISHKWLDLSEYPDAKDLEKYLNNLDKITEFYIYTGEKNEDPEINPVKILNMEFYDEDGKIYKINSGCYKHALDWKTN